jgi:hypothetical protein
MMPWSAWEAMRDRILRGEPALRERPIIQLPPMSDKFREELRMYGEIKSVDEYVAEVKRGMGLAE